MIDPNLTKLTGKWVMVEGRVVADDTCNRIFDFIRNDLIERGHDKSGWDTLYQDPRNDTFWELTYPQSELQGGGPPELQRISTEDAKQKYNIQER